MESLFQHNTLHFVKVAHGIQYCINLFQLLNKHQINKKISGAYFLVVKLHTCLPGHAAELQTWVTLAAPSEEQSFPPFFGAGFVHVLVRN